MPSVATAKAAGMADWRSEPKIVSPGAKLDLAAHSPKTGGLRSEFWKGPAMRFLAGLALLCLPLAAAEAQRTIVNDGAALARLRRNSGITLQWISFESPARGHVRVSEAAGRIHLTGSQMRRGGAGRLELDGDVVEIGELGFTFRGRIAITDAPDPGRACLRDGTYEFRITGRRRYWRLQQMEQCDGLTDYVDIYF
jgi:hypothetical protein